MRTVFEKTFLLFCGCVMLILQPVSGISVAAFLTAVTFGAIGSLISKRWLYYAVGSGYMLLCLIKPEFRVFLPLIFYDVFALCHPAFCASVLIPVLLSENAISQELSQTAMILLFLGFSCFLSRGNLAFEKQHDNFLKMRDSGKETAILLENKNKELMEKQDYEVRLATLTERNRIAREIHDNVGHMLSRSILQVGALMAINRDETVGKALGSLQGTLSQAMDSIRTSVHDLHDESIDLNIQVQSIIREFTFCPVRLEYDVDRAMEKGLKYTFLSIIKEALSNVARHSNATQVTIVLREHPAFYQLIIKDNGTESQEDAGEGIGLQNMTDRVNAYHGQMLIERKKGFRIFISVPKGETAK